MPVLFNIFTGTLDYIDQGGTLWLSPVATEGDLPLTDPNGAVRVVTAEDVPYVFDTTGSQWHRLMPVIITPDASSTANGISISEVDTGDITKFSIKLHPADGTNPGIITTGAQTIAGNKTFTGNTKVDGGIDVTATGGTDTLSIGTANADVVNIGRSGATINIQGTTNYEQVDQLQVSDPLVTINKGGGVGSGANSGIEIEEDSSITGYAQTSADRNSWILKAPNTAGDATITPGASGITLNQSSHNPVTLAAVGSSPNANGATLSTQALNLEPASGSFPGVVTTGTQTLAGDKTLSGTTTALTTQQTTIKNASGTDTLIVGTTDGFARPQLWSPYSGLIFKLGAATADTDPLNALSEGIVVHNTNLAGDPQDGSNEGYARIKADRFGLFNLDSSAGINQYYFRADGTELFLRNDSGTYVFRVTRATGNTSIVGTINLPSLTASTPLKLDGSKNIISADIDLTTDVTGVMPIANGGTNSSTALGNNKVMVSSGGAIVESSTITTDELDFINGVIKETSFSIANNQGSPANVTGLAFANGSIRSALVQYSIFTDATSDLYEAGELELIQRGADWMLSQETTGDNSQVVFDVDTNGQVTYTSANLGGFVSSTMKFKAQVTTV